LALCAAGRYAVESEHHGVTRPAQPKRVTGLRPDARIPGYLVVEIDGQRFTSLPADLVSSFGIERDEEIGAEALERLARAADVEAAYRVSLRLLATRPRAVHELLRKLRERGHNPSAAAEAVGRLEVKGLLNDGEFARHFARVRLGRGHGPARILVDLLARGVERRTAERAIDEVVDAEGVDVSHHARALAQKRLRQLGPLPAETAKRRLLSYLNRRGYRGYEVTAMVDELIGAGE